MHIYKIDMREGGGPATLKIAKYDTPDDLFKNAFVRDIYYYIYYLCYIIYKPSWLILNKLLQAWIVTVTDVLCMSQFSVV